MNYEQTNARPQNRRNPISTILIMIIVAAIVIATAVSIVWFSGIRYFKINTEDGGNRQFIMVQLPKLTEEKSEANEELTNAIDALMVIVENYPDLKANQNFIQLSDELAGTENRIATSRRDYNEVVTDYNTTIKKFPTNIIASLFGFEKKDYFEVSEGKTEVPEVEF